jgi:uracil-DNA glycosylase
MAKCFQHVREHIAMPTETIIVVVGVVAAFAIFSLVLAWADHRTTR